MSTEDVAPIKPIDEKWSPEKGWEKCYKEGTKYIFICSVISTISALSTIFVPFLSFLTIPINLISILLMPIIHIVYARPNILNPAYAKLSPSRRIFLRWGSRLAFVQLVTYVYTPSVFWVAIITCPLGFLGFTKIQQKIISWQLDREEKGLPLTIIEKLALGLLLCFSAAIFFIAILFSAGIGFFIQWVMSLYA